MAITLSNKEKMLLQDQKAHEQMCVEKYTNYSNQAKDPQLKQLFTNNANVEQQHFNSINSLLNGEIPQMNAGTSNGSMNNSAANSVASGAISSNAQSGMANVADSELCKDMLMTEKYISGAYDTTIFEFRDSNARNMLNHIQKEEQQHGEAIYNYMSSKGMYNAS